MKKTFILIAIMLMPLMSFAAEFDVLTKPNSSPQLVEFYEDDYDKWCDDEPSYHEYQIERKTALIETVIGSRAKKELQAEVDQHQIDYKKAIEECQNIKKLMSPDQSAVNLSCGDGYALMGKECIEHTLNCEIQYGPNITGYKVEGSETTSGCVCNEGYEFSNGACMVPAIEEVVPPVAVQTKTIYIEVPATKKNHSKFASVQTDMEAPIVIEQEEVTEPVVEEAPVIEAKPTTIKRIVSWLKKIF